MKKLATFPVRNILEKIYGSDKLRRDFDEYIQNVENDYLADICNLFRGCDYSIGFFNRNYISPRDNSEFLDGAAAVVDSFGGSEALEKAVRHAEGLRGSNLFGWACQKVASALLDWVDMLCDGVEKVSLKIDRGEVDGDTLDYAEYFAESGYMDGIYVTNNGELCRLERL